MCYLFKFKSSLANRLPRSSDLTPKELELAGVLGISSELYAKVRDVNISHESGDNNENHREQAVRNNPYRKLMEQQ